MKRTLQAWFAFVLGGMLAVTVWASRHENVARGLGKILREPWAAATLADAYAGFAAVCLWVCWRESRWAARAAWTAAILVLGNIAISFYVLLALARAPEGEPFTASLFRRKNP